MCVVTLFHTYIQEQIRRHSYNMHAHILLCLFLAWRSRADGKHRASNSLTDILHQLDLDYEQHSDKMPAWLVAVCDF